MEHVVYVSPGGFLQVIETPRKYYYARRKNKNSVAVFLLRKEENGEWSILIRMQPLPLHNADLDNNQQCFPCPITGGFDLDGEDPVSCATREVEEEAGYTDTQLHFFGSYIVGTQTDETVFMFWGDVTGCTSNKALGDGTFFESVSWNEWKTLSCLRESDYVACQLGYYKLCEVLEVI